MGSSHSSPLVAPTTLGAARGSALLVGAPWLAQNIFTSVGSQCSQAGGEGKERIAPNPSCVRAQKSPSVGKDVELPEHLFTFPQKNKGNISTQKKTGETLRKKICKVTTQKWPPFPASLFRAPLLWFFSLTVKDKLWRRR